MFKNKTLVIVVLALAVLLVGAGAYLNLSKSAKIAPQPSVTKEQPKTSPSGVTGTLKSLFGKNQYCVVTYPDNGGSGTVYVSGNKFRGDFTTKIAGEKEVTSQVVSDGIYTYVWSSESPTGIKMKIDVTSPTASAQTGNFNLDQEVGLNCSPWGVDASKFAVPTNIQFTDLSSMTAPKAESGTTKTQTASPCDQISDPTAKAACVNALNSNQ